MPIGRHEFLGILAGVVSASDFFLYRRSVLKGDTVPSIATWMVWTIVGGMTLAASLFAGGLTSTVWMAIVYFVGPGTIAYLAIEHGKKGDATVKIVETVCLIATPVCVLAWLIALVTRSAVVALIIFLAIDCLGGVPTIVKSYYYPKEENLFIWTLSLTSSILNLLAVEDWTFAKASYPVFLFFSIGTTVAVIFFRRKK